jgi:hypothetical protein
MRGVPVGNVQSGFCGLDGGCGDCCETRGCVVCDDGSFAGRTVGTDGVPVVAAKHHDQGQEQYRMFHRTLCRAVKVVFRSRNRMQIRIPPPGTTQFMCQWDICPRGPKRAKRKQRVL